MKIWEKDGWVFVQLMDLTTKEMLIDFSVGKEYWEELKDHIIKHLNEFKLSSDETDKLSTRKTRLQVAVSAGLTDSKSEPKKDDGHQSIADMMIDDAFDRGDLP